MNWPWAYMCPFLPKPSSHLPPHPVPPGCHRALGLGAQYDTSNFYWLSVLHMVMCMFQRYSLKLSQPMAFSVTNFIKDKVHIGM